MLAIVIMLILGTTAALGGRFWWKARQRRQQRARRRTNTYVCNPQLRPFAARRDAQPETVPDQAGHRDS